MRRSLVILRDYTSWAGTPGTAYIKNLATGQLDRFSHSIELPWLNNKQGVSCIPPGEYDCEVTFSPKYRRTMYLVKSVKDRAGIRIHSGSFAGSVERGYRCHLLGCLSLGFSLTGGIEVTNQLLLGRSREAMRKFRELMNDEPFRLIITGDFPCLEQ